MRKWMIGAALALAGCGEPEPKLSNGRTASEMEIEAQVAVMDQLRDPESARFDNITVSDRDRLVAVCGTVNAKNAFGGYAGEKPFTYARGSAVLADPTRPETVLVVGAVCSGSAEAAH